MKQQKSVFICQGCGYRSPGWLGKCPDCEQWNSLVETLDAEKRRFERLTSPSQAPTILADIKIKEDLRRRSGIQEFDRVIGGGIVPGSVVLIGGEPGIGKSTLLLQAADRLSQAGDGAVLYVSGEESLSQTKLRADRLGSTSNKLFIVSEADLELIIGYIEKLKPQLVIIDSIQVIYKSDLPTSPGTISQVRETALELTRLAKTTGIPVVLVGHLTKDGSIAGPRVLEHMVDTVLYFEGDRYQSYRILRAIKNRFGSTNEIGVFEMTPEGLMEVVNPSQTFLTMRSEGTAGNIVVPVLEGTRPILVEVQVLVSPTNFGVPQRRAIGIDYNRISLLLAVLEKRAGFAFGKYDVFVNVSGGIWVDETAIDLGFCIACASSYKNILVDPADIALGEIGLGGEIRPIPYVTKRLEEAERLGFSRCIIGKASLKGLKTHKGKIKIVDCNCIDEALGVALKERG